MLAFTGLEYYLVNAPFAAKLAMSMTGGFSWLIVIGLFMAVGYIADKLSRSENSEQIHYLGLGPFVIAEAIVFLPLLFVATMFGGSGLIPTAWMMTLLLVGGITTTVFITKKDFSFMKGILSIGGCVALGFIIYSIIFGIFSGISVRIGHGFICRRLCPIHHIKYFTPLLTQSARCCFIGPFFLSSPFVLLHFTGLDEPCWGRG